jgi:hypothetical protein
MKVVRKALELLNRSQAVLLELLDEDQPALKIEILEAGVCVQKSSLLIT